MGESQLLLKWFLKFKDFIAISKILLSNPAQAQSSTVCGMGGQLSGMWAATDPDNILSSPYLRTAREGDPEGPE